MAKTLSPRIETADFRSRVEVAYRNQSGRMWRALLAYSGDPDVASDAVSEAYAQAPRRSAELRDVALGEPLARQDSSA
ncbi:MAG: hypothetical protein U9R51_05630 [Actinomycetota bacterium]|nr:hypothetical protein [Actinomycetota bacterium]